MSIRLRLTLWYVLVLCAGLALFAGAIIWQTEQSAHAALDDSLRRRARDIAADLTIGRTITLRADGPNESEKTGEATLLIRVLDGTGRVVVRQGPTVPGLPAGLLVTTTPGFYDGDAPHDAQVRLFVQAIRADGRRRATIQVLTTTAPLDAARRQLLTAMGATGIAIALAAMLGGLFLADRALRPVDRITRPPPPAPPAGPRGAGGPAGARPTPPTNSRPPSPRSPAPPRSPCGGHAAPRTTRRRWGMCWRRAALWAAWSTTCCSSPAPIRGGYRWSTNS